ncbi:TetR family transcriptional regulator [uncultured Jatrophihabitans sp.]|uniref:TetR family transcriptional regulator n=1 Tax=uncultured Jatrophihabitans sp. TaxID=1610747 RepID=UPI0035CAA00A
MSGPLFDTLFRPTTQPGASSAPPGQPARADAAERDLASAPPQRTAGSHTRAGNAMARTRAALLSGAARAVEATGLKITMSQVAAAAGVAKATLYNHFRTRDAVLDAVLLDQVSRLVDAQADKPLETALADAARAIADNPVRRAVARLEPAALAGLGRIDTTAPAWQIAHTGVAAALDAAGRGGTDTVLRWLASFILTPAAHDSIAADVAVLVAGLPRVAARAVDAHVEQARSA